MTRDLGDILYIFLLEDLNGVYFLGVLDVDYRIRIKIALRK